MTTRLAKNLRPGDLIDLSGDYFVDRKGDHPMFSFEFQTVTGVERETLNCVRVDIEGVDSFGFPPAHKITLVRRGAK